MEEGEVKRSDFHQLEDKGSPYGLLIVVAVLAIFVVIGLVWDPQPLNPANPVPPQPPVESIRIEVNSQPQGASLLIDGRRFEQAPAVLSVSAEKSELVICAQWPAQESFTAPVHCRKVPVSLLEQGPYVFAAEQK